MFWWTPYWQPAQIIWQTRIVKSQQSYLDHIMFRFFFLFFILVFNILIQYTDNVERLILGLRWTIFKSFFFLLSIYVKSLQVIFEIKSSQHTFIDLWIWAPSECAPGSAQPSVKPDLWIWAPLECVFIWHVNMYLMLVSNPDGSNTTCWDWITHT